MQHYLIMVGLERGLHPYVGLSGNVNLRTKCDIEDNRFQVENVKEISKLDLKAVDFDVSTHHPNPWGDEILGSTIRLQIENCRILI